MSVVRWATGGIPQAYQYTAAAVPSRAHPVSLLLLLSVIGSLVADRRSLPAFSLYVYNYMTAAPGSYVIYFSPDVERCKSLCDMERTGNPVCM
jgi:hypothetical protein